jgi:signal-transduction protein with cAMP-binding, CBS, and nucleotidyltransferase domain
MMLAIVLLLLDYIVYRAEWLLQTAQDRCKTLQDAAVAAEHALADAVAAAAAAAAAVPAVTVLATATSTAELQLQQRQNHARALQQQACAQRGAAVTALREQADAAYDAAAAAEAQVTRLESNANVSNGSVELHESLGTAVKLMSARSGSRISVVDRARRPVGVITVHDLARIAVAVDAAGAPSKAQRRGRGGTGG